ncbi:MAG: hypothetical protein P4L76_12135 [Beijerinckiaceae bacterium]|nr:hypothetical protein [Beijerinckiaceae bacterium]
MREPVAASISEVLLRHAKELDDLLRDVHDTCSGGEFEQAKNMVNSVKAAIWERGLTPLFSEHRDLDRPGPDVGSPE